MITEFPGRSLSKFRHPERSEAKNILFPLESHPSAVEGPACFYLIISESDSNRSEASWSGGLLRRDFSLRNASPFNPRRSFDSDSTPSFGKTTSPTRLAQDDGAFFALRLPELCP